MPGGYGTDHRTRLVGLSNDPHLVLQAPAPPTIPPGDDLHHAIHPHTSTADLRSSLRRQEAQTQTALGGGIQFTDRLHAFTRDWNVRPVACALYRARTKGKDERGVGYVKHNAIAGRRFASWGCVGDPSGLVDA